MSIQDNINQILNTAMASFYIGKETKTAKNLQATKEARSQLAEDYGGLKDIAYNLSRNDGKKYSNIERENILSRARGQTSRIYDLMVKAENNPDYGYLKKLFSGDSPYKHKNIKELTDVIDRYDKSQANLAKTGVDKLEQRERMNRMKEILKGTPSEFNVDLGGK